MDAVKALAPGSTIGILGGGQLGRMLSHAAARLGYRCHILCPEKDCPAAQVSAVATVADYDDRHALAAFAEQVDVVTLEFENIPVETVRLLSERVDVRPGAKVLEVAQDRLFEKRAVQSIGAKPAPFEPVDSLPALEQAVRNIGLPAVLKTRRLGYDGKGQAMLRNIGDVAPAWDRVGGGDCILEGFVDFALEVSVIVARDRNGATACYVPVENRHRDGILDRTIAPADIAAETARETTEIAVRLASDLDVVGLLAVEMFVTPDGDVLVNEMAPRVHNSGHWTMEACIADQFEQQIRAVAGLPLGLPDRHANAVMENLIGDEAGKWHEILAEPGAALHLYGKAEARPGRKMGHVIRLWPLDRKPEA